LLGGTYISQKLGTGYGYEGGACPKPAAWMTLLSYVMCSGYEGRAESSDVPRFEREGGDGSGLLGVGAGLTTAGWEPLGLEASD
jgi:hypothetical protein